VECFASGFNLTSIFDDSDLSKTTHWLAGLLEGEGSFKAPAPSAPNLISISLMMTDEDTIARVAHSFGVKYHQVKTRQPHHKTPYSVHLRGTNAYYLMRALYPLMSLRRQLQIDKALQHHQHNPHKYLTDDQAREVKQRIAAGQTNIQIATEMQIDYEIIRGIKRGRSYKYVMI
jgi:DNA-binding CsgD family transcriptional regulator